MIDNVVTYLPHGALMGLFSALHVARFENQRWIRARKGGKRGMSEVVGVFVDLIGFSAMLFYYLFLISFGLDNSIWHAGILFLVASIVGLLASIVFTSIFRGDNLILWILGTLAIIPLQVLLFSEVSWFGFR